jgi:hypothetical protein
MPISTEDGFRIRYRFGAQRAVDDPPLHRLAVGEPKATDMKSRVTHPISVLTGELQLR